ncbi:nitric oxide synthase oxygenase [Paenibacillus sp. FSL W8-0186]|nr:nitric oxide synthase oxygenase [Paenibacillus woosongensis]
MNNERSFETQKSKHVRSITGDWKWLIPPVSPA